MKSLLILATALTFSMGIHAQDGKTQDATKTHDSKMKKDHVMMKDGKMMIMQNGSTGAMMGDMTMSDGTMVMLNGTVKKPDGTTITLKNGEGVDMDGKMMHMHGAKAAK